MADFFLKSGDMQRAESAVFMDDIDMIYSPSGEIGPYGPILVVVALRQGTHVCQQCGEPFNSQKPGLKGVEVKCGGGTVPILLHAKCSGASRLKSFRSHADILRGMQARRFYAKAVGSVEKAANSAEKKVIG